MAVAEDSRRGEDVIAVVWRLPMCVPLSRCLPPPPQGCRGSVPQRDFYASCETIGLKLNPEQDAVVLTSYDIHGDGDICYDEFLQYAYEDVRGTEHLQTGRAWAGPGKPVGELNEVLPWLSGSPSPYGRRSPLQHPSSGLSAPSCVRAHPRLTSSTLSRLVGCERNVRPSSEVTW